MHARPNILMRASPTRPSWAARCIRRILVVSCTAIGNHADVHPRDSQPAAAPSARPPEPGDSPRLPAAVRRAARHYSGRLATPANGKVLFAWRTLRRQQFDLAVILHGNEPQTTPLAYLSNALDFSCPTPAILSAFIEQPASHSCAGKTSSRHRAKGWPMPPWPAARQPTGRWTCRWMSATAVLVDDWLRRHGVTRAQRVLGLQTGASTVSRLAGLAACRAVLAAGRRPATGDCVDRSAATVD